MWTTPAAAASDQIACACSASTPSGFSQKTCLPARAAAIVGSAWRLLGPALSNSSTRSSAISACPSAGDPPLPVAGRPPPAEPLGCGGQLRLVAAADRDQARLRDRRLGDGADRPQ